MTLPFFRALKPWSTDSGVETHPWAYCDGSAIDYDRDKKEEIKDKLIMDVIHERLTKQKQSKNVSDDLKSIYKILCGQHYKWSTPWLHCGDDFSKGLLDYLFLPLVARKLIADAGLYERKDHRFTNIMAWVIAIPLEIARMSLAFALIILIAPIVAIVHLIKDCLPGKNMDHNSLANNPPNLRLIT